MNAFVNGFSVFRVQQQSIGTLHTTHGGSSRVKGKRNVIIRKSTLKPLSNSVQVNCTSSYYYCRNASNVLDQPLGSRLSRGSFKRPWFFGGAPRRILVWFFADLRVEDNEALIKAAQNGAVPGGLVLPLVALHKEIPRSAIVELKTELQRRGSDLCVLPKFCTDSILEICHKYGIEAIYYNYAELPDQMQLQNDVITDLENRGVQVKGFWSNTLVSPEQMESIKASDIGFRKFSQEAKNVKTSEPLRTPDKLPRVPEDIPTRMVDSSTGAAQGFSITESTAWSLLDSVPKNSESEGSFIFRLKPYLDCGCISPRNLLDAVRNRNAKHSFSKGMLQLLYSELLWRSYVTLVAQQRLKVKSGAAIHHSA
jgi:deoxyribodipyrimidine photolyase